MRKISRKLANSLLAGLCLTLMLLGGCGSPEDSTGTVGDNPEMDNRPGQNAEGIATEKQNSEDQSETDGWEGKYGYYELEGKVEQEFIDYFLGTGAFENKPYFSYINPDGKLQLALWHNTDSDLWCGIRYAVTESEKTDGYPYGFVIDGENQKDVAEWNLEPVEEVLGLDEFLDINAVPEKTDNIKEDTEWDTAGRILSYRVSGDVLTHDYEKDADVVREAEYFYSINYTYYDNGMTEKTYDHNTFYFGTLGHFSRIIYDENDREVYSRFFWTSYFSGEGYYLYDSESEHPVCEVLIDQGTQGVPPWMRFLAPE